MLIPHVREKHLLFLVENKQSRSLALLGMTIVGAFFISLLEPNLARRSSSV